MAPSGIETAVPQPTALLRIPYTAGYLCEKSHSTGNIQDTTLCNEDATMILIKIDMYYQ
jgi:hypothetical protein